MFVNEFDYNSAGDLNTGYLIRKKHFENYFKTNLVLLDPENIKSFSDLSKLLQ